MNPEKNTLIPYVYNVSINDPFKNYPRKVIHSNFSFFMDTLNLIWCKSLRVWFGNLACNVKKWPGESFLTLKNDAGSHFSTGSLFNVTPSFGLLQLASFDVSACLNFIHSFMQLKQKISNEEAFTILTRFPSECAIRYSAWPVFCKDEDPILQTYIMPIARKLSGGSSRDAAKARAC